MLIPTRLHRAPRSLATLIACLLLLLHVKPADAQDIDRNNDPLAQPERWLTDQRWSELRYGLSVREPHEAIRVPDTPQGDAIRWALNDGTRISLAFVRGIYEGAPTYDKRTGKALPVRMPAKIDLLKKQFDEEMRASITGEVINTRNNQTIEVGELVGVINYFILKPSAQGATPLMRGFALLQLDEQSVAVVNLECKPDNLDSAIRTFECLVHSIEVQSPQEINKQLNDWMVNAEQLLANLTQDDRVKAMRSDRLFRVIDDGKDLGYTRIWQRFQDQAYYDKLKEQDKKNGGEGKLYGINQFAVKGNAYIMQAHLEGEGAEIDRLIEAIDDTSAVNGYWQIKNSLSYKKDPGNFRAGTWAETGIRGVAVIDGKRTDHVQITREGTPPRNMVDFLLARERDPERRLRYPSADPRSYPSGDLKEYAWPTPKRAYLSFVDAELMPALLPREEKAYLFYAYDAESTKIDLRLMRVEPTGDGGKTVYVRPVLDKAEQKLVFDRNNDLISHTYPDGRELRRTTREELAKVWGVRLRD